MKSPILLRWSAAAGLFAALGQIAGHAAEQEHWVSTWAASPQAPQASNPPRPAANAASATTPGAAPVRRAPPRPAPLATFRNQTIRMIAHSTIGGRRVRIELSNSFGSVPLVIGAAHIALRDRESAIVPASDRTLLFGGQPTCWIPPGAAEISDPVDLDVPAASDLAVSIYIPEDVKAATLHNVGLHTTYVAKDDVTARPLIADPVVNQSYYWLTRIDVAAPPDAAAIVTLGDSITDGALSTADTDHSWPSFLARRIASSGGANIAVLNEGISGNRLLRDNAGVNALARFDRDVLAQPGVKWLMILEGINDIGRGSQADTPVSDAVGSDQIIAALKQLIERAHEHGIKVIGCTLTPYEGAAYYTEGGEQIRLQVNQWIRSARAFDAVVDFDAATRDPEHPKQFRPDFNDGDHLHPNDAGYEAMANAIDLSVFGLKPGATAAK
jgi:lysophospholipase L1-like esterase